MAVTLFAGCWTCRVRVRVRVRVGLFARCWTCGFIYGLFRLVFNALLSMADLMQVSLISRFELKLSVP